MAAYDVTRTPGGDPDDLDLGEGIDNGLRLEAEDTVGRDDTLVREQGEELIDADGRNPTQRALDERLAAGAGDRPVDASWPDGGTTDDRGRRHDEP